MTPGPLSADDIRRLFGELASELVLRLGSAPRSYWSAVRPSRCASTRAELHVTWTRSSPQPILFDMRQQRSPNAKGSTQTG